MREREQTGTARDRSLTFYTARLILVPRGAPTAVRGSKRPVGDEPAGAARTAIHLPTLPVCPPPLHAGGFALACE